MKKVLEELTNVDETAVGKTFPSLSRTGIRQVRSKFKGIITIFPNPAKLFSKNKIIFFKTIYIIYLI